MLLPRVRDRAMVMKRYPHGAAGSVFFTKQAPTPRPDWNRTCIIERQSGNAIDCPVIDELSSRHRAPMTSEYRVAKRPRGRVLVDYNQNRWGSTLASVYSVRPRLLVTVSTPLT